MKILQKLSERYAVKKFDSNKKLSNKQLEILLNSMRLTPSSFGLEPYRFIVIEDQTLKEKLCKHSFNQEQVIDASHLIIISIEKKIDNHFINKYISNIANTREILETDLDGYKQVLLNFINTCSKQKLEQWAIQQAFIVLGNLLTVCAIEEIDACPIGGFLPEKYNELLQLNEKSLHAVAVIPVGYRCKTDKYQYLKKVRRPLNELIIKM